jgi:hypothetical protein
MTPVVGEDADDLTEADRRDREEDAAQPADRIGEQRGDQRRGEHGGDDRREQRPVRVHGQDRRDIGGDPHEGRLGERELTRLERDREREREGRVDADLVDQLRVLRVKVGENAHLSSRLRLA